MRPVMIRPKAELDLQDAIRWYDGERDNLGDEFLIAFRKSLARIGAYPESFRVVRTNVRRVVVDGFPYSVYYRVTKHAVWIIAVMHTARHPRNWMNR